MFKIIKTRLKQAKGIWSKELPSVLWEYRTIVRTSTEETLFQLAYGSKVVTPAKVELVSYRVDNYNAGRNDEAMRL